MDQIVNKFLLAEDKFGFTLLDLHIVLVDHIQKTKKEYKNLLKQEIQDIFIKTN